MVQKDLQKAYRHITISNVRKPFESRAGGPLSPTEFLLLAAIRSQQAQSVYALREQLGLPPGGFIPVLNNLVRNGFLNKGKAGQRGKRQFSITPAGEQELNQTFPAILAEALEGDLQAVTRTLSAIRMFKSEAAEEFVRCVISHRRWKSDEQAKRAAALKPKIADPIIFHRWIQSLALQRVFEAESQLFQEILDQLRSASSGNQGVNVDGDQENH